MKPAELKAFLDSLYYRYQNDYLSLDPLEFVHEYPSPEDQEIVAFIAAALAIGRVDLFRKVIQTILKIMQPSPRVYVRRFDPEAWTDLQGFVYRFYRREDIGLLLSYLKQILDRHDTLETFFLLNYSASQLHTGSALSAFVKGFLQLDPLPFYAQPPAKGQGIRHFLSNPEDGSSCKRLNLFLRWMVRRDNLDLGIWTKVSPAKLIIPVDTHIARISRKLTLTQRKAASWKMALEITEKLKHLDPEDPVKYDFALCTVGKLNACPKEKNDLGCVQCPVKEFCLGG